MTTPQPPQQQAPPVQPPPSPLTQAAETELVTTAAGLLLTAASAAALVAAMVAKFRIQRDLAAGLFGSAGIAMQSPPPVVGIVGPASAQTSRQNLIRRAQFVVSAGKRLAGDIRQARAQGKPVRTALADGLARERRYYSAHIAAIWNRAVAAGKTDMAALEHGKILGWNTVRDSKASPECVAADRHNYRADRMPKIGWPGGVHPFAAVSPGRLGRGRGCCLSGWPMRARAA